MTSGISNEIDVSGNFLRTRELWSPAARCSDRACSKIWKFQPCLTMKRRKYSSTCCVPLVPKRLFRCHRYFVFWFCKRKNWKYCYLFAVWIASYEYCEQENWKSAYRSRMPASCVYRSWSRGLNRLVKTLMGFGVSGQHPFGVCGVSAVGVSSMSTHLQCW